MPYRIKRLPSFDTCAFEADEKLYALSPPAADRYFADYNKKIENLKRNPNMYQVFEDIPYFRSAGLVYGYRLFYHVDEQNEMVILHRVLHGAMDLAEHLKADKSETG